ncbi:hypothetical protein WCP94_003403 [Bilophila wadsworthia]
MFYNQYKLKKHKSASKILDGAVETLRNIDDLCTAYSVGCLGTRRSLSQKDLLSKLGSSVIVQIGQNEKTTVAEFGT